MEVTLNYFRREYLAFREIAGSREYTTGQIWDGLQGLLYAYAHLKCKKSEKKDVDALMLSLLQVELPRRMALRETYIFEK